MKEKMSNSVAIVTGIGGDIGLAIAQRLLVAGYKIFGVDIDESAAMKSVQNLNASISQVKAIQCDVTCEMSVKNMAALARQFGTVQLLVNNAGSITAASLQSMDNASWKKDVDLNLSGAFNCFKGVEDDLKANNGNLINIASVNGMGTFGHPAYSIAKAGLIHFTKMVAVEYGKFGIRANAVAPGTVRTQAWEERARIDPEIFKHAKRWYPLRRLAKSADVANAVSFLASPEADAISGICLPVDCGLLAGQTELANTFSQSEDY